MGDGHRESCVLRAAQFIAGAMCFQSSSSDGNLAYDRCRFGDDSRSLCEGRPNRTCLCDQLGPRATNQCGLVKGGPALGSGRRLAMSDCQKRVGHVDTLGEDRVVQCIVLRRYFCSCNVSVWSFGCSSSPAAAAELQVA